MVVNAEGLQYCIDRIIKLMLINQGLEHSASGLIQGKVSTIVYIDNDAFILKLLENYTSF